MTCTKCEGTGWVCESCGTRWEFGPGSTCCGAGEPCECNPDAEYAFEVVHASVDPAQPPTTFH